MMTPEEYAQKIDAKRERLERAADRASDGATAAYQRARAATAGIEFGQPILVGHHSEGRHRNAIKRSDNAMRKSCELSKAAEDLTRRAESVGTGGISSDDPEAIAKLADKRTDLERQRDLMKAINAAFKKGDDAKLLALTGKGLEAWTAAVAGNFSWDKRPYASYILTNLGARIRDAAKRAATIERTAEIPASETVVGLCTITVDPDENRVLMAFPARLTREDYKSVRGGGFVWSPTRNAFVRKLSQSALWVADSIARTITEQEG